jgi:hypothetical protein
MLTPRTLIIMDEPLAKKRQILRLENLIIVIKRSVKEQTSRKN